jgi:glutathione S-transferase
MCVSPKRRQSHPEEPVTHSRTRLITFGISHFCEKARWALDWHGIPYEEIGWPPGWHLVLAKRCGARANTLPIVLDGEAVIQGSGAIIDWAERKGKDPRRRLVPRGNLTEAKEIERRADELIGVHVRRLVYAETLPAYSRLVKPALFLGTSGSQRLIGNIMWPVTRRMMMWTYDIRPGAACESRSKLEAELDWLDSKLADGRPYLVGDRFSRVDLTMASLLAGFAQPKEMAVYHDMRIDPLTADVERWSQRPVMRWVISQYQKHRNSSSITGTQLNRTQGTRLGRNN